jgi:hypothetical protein
MSPGWAAAITRACDVHGDAADVAVAQLDLAGVQPRPELDADARQLSCEGRRAADRPAGGVHDVGEQHRRQDPRRRCDARDAGQERLDMVQGKLRCLPDEGRIGPWKLEQARLGDVVGEVASVPPFDRLPAAAAAGPEGCASRLPTATPLAAPPGRPSVSAMRIPGALRRRPFLRKVTGGSPPPPAAPNGPVPPGPRRHPAQAAGSDGLMALPAVLPDLRFPALRAGAQPAAVPWARRWPWAARRSW